MLPVKKPQRRFLNEFRGLANIQKQDYLDLVDALNYHNYLYYAADTPEISDADYDAMMRLLQQWEHEHPEWKVAGSPSEKVGSEIRKEFPEARHNPPMLSLDNATDFAEVKEFHNRVVKLLQENGIRQEIIYYGETKYDGLALEIEYEDGILVRGSTRGNGVVGEDITHNVKTIRNVPQKLLLPYPPKYLSIRGECILRHEDFFTMNEELKEKGEKPFANPRNAAAGTLRQQNSKIAAERNLRFYPYMIGRVEESDLSQKHNPLPDHQYEIITEYIASAGFSKSEFARRLKIHDIEPWYREMLEKRPELPFDIDGLVLKVDNTNWWNVLGATSKYPRWAIAYKFPARSAITILEDVQFQVGRTGIVTPVAHLKPINIGGVIVMRASLHNKDELSRLQIQIGDYVEVIRAGDVIPKVVKLYKAGSNRRKIVFPTKCPVCKTPLKQEEVYVRCPNPECPAKIVQSLQYFASKDGMDFEGVGSEWVAKFYDLGFVKDPADFYFLTEEKLKNLEGMGDILPRKMIEAIQARKEVPLHHFLMALGIPNVGPYTAEVLAKHFKNLDNIVNATEEELSSVYEIGPIIAKSVHEFFASEKTKKLLKKFQEAGLNILEEKHDSSSRKLEGKTFVFTGTLSSLSRKEAEDMVKKLGGKPTSSVSKKTHY
ncbi:MAG: NAD-dependent DNA ligase LigA, partial [Candidatus Hydrogenedentota bacterium]